MSAWILIVMLTYDARAGGAASAEFASKEACQAAISAISAEAATTLWVRPRLAICVPKGEAR